MFVFIVVLFLLRCLSCEPSLVSYLQSDILGLLHVHRSVFISWLLDYTRVNVEKLNLLLIDLSEWKMFYAFKRLPLGCREKQCHLSVNKLFHTLSTLNVVLLRILIHKSAFSMQFQVLFKILSLSTNNCYVHVYSYSLAKGSQSVVLDQSKKGYARL